MVHIDGYVRTHFRLSKLGKIQCYKDTVKRCIIHCTMFSSLLQQKKSYLAKMLILQNWEVLDYRNICFSLLAFYLIPREPQITWKHIKTLNTRSQTNQTPNFKKKKKEINKKKKKRKKRSDICWPWKFRFETWQFLVLI